MCWFFLFLLPLSFPFSFHAPRKSRMVTKKKTESGYAEQSASRAAHRNRTPRNEGGRIRHDEMRTEEAPRGLPKQNPRMCLFPHGGVCVCARAHALIRPPPHRGWSPFGDRASLDKPGQGYMLLENKTVDWPLSSWFNRLVDRSQLGRDLSVQAPSAPPSHIGETTQRHFVPPVSSRL